MESMDNTEEREGKGAMMREDRGCREGRER
jgi:hypothetical protein